MWFIALAWGSDPFGGGRVPARSHDITDVYAWVEGGERSTLALAMKVRAKKNTGFNPDLTYRLHIRRASIDGAGADTHVETGNAWWIDCHLTDTDDMRCRLHADGPHCRACERVLTMPVGDRIGGSAPGVQGFAGRVAPGNALALVFAIDVDEIFGEDGLFSVSAHTTWSAHLPDVPRLSR